MSFIDEEIVRLAQKKKQLAEQEQAAQNEEIVAEDEISEQEVIEGMKSGELKIFDRKIFFEEYSILEGKLMIYLPCEYLEVKRDTNSDYQMINNRQEISFNANFMKDWDHFEGLIKIKEGMQKTFKPMGVKLRWLEEGSSLIKGSPVHYLDYLNITALGIFYNVLSIFTTAEGRFTLNFNFNEDEKKYWLPIAKAMITIVKEEG